MKTENKAKLLFSKNVIIELNDKELDDVNGGTISIFVETIIRITTYGTWIDHGPL